MTLYDILLEKMNGIEYRGYFMSCCVFHEDTKPSLMVHENGFKCLSCGKKGRIEILARKVLNERKINEINELKYKKHRPVLPEWAIWEKKFGDLNGIVEHAHKMLIKFPSYQFYFKKRLLMGFAKKGMFGFISGWCLFPVFRDDGKLLDVVVRSSRSDANTRYVLRPDDSRKSPYIYCPDWSRVERSSLVYVVFGIIDSWALYSIGLPVVTGTSGKSLNSERLEEMEKEFIIIPDKGEEKDAYLLANKLGWRGDVKLLKYPDGCKDSDDVRRKFGDEKLNELIGDSNGFSTI